MTGDKDKASFDKTFNKEHPWCAVPFDDKTNKRLEMIGMVVENQFWPFPSVLNAKTGEVLLLEAFDTLRSDLTYVPTLIESLK